MANLNLTDAERLILANQYEILSHLTPDPSLSDLARNLRDGHKWLYQDSLQFKPELDAATQEHVLQIMDIYHLMNISYQKLADKTGIDAKGLHFPGFDGNNESDEYSFANALARSGRYNELLGDAGKNSHGATTEMYTRMIGAWRKLGEPKFPLTKEHIASILAAQRHRAAD